MNAIANQNAAAYASRNQLEIGERLGFGIHGIVHVAQHKLNHNLSAIKGHSSSESYFRERNVYERLREASVIQITGFNVPKLISFDDSLRVIEMTIVKQPFVLDFAGAYLDTLPEFSEELWTEWERDKREQFGTRWPAVQQILSAFEELGIHLIDISPSNIAFRDP